MDAFRQIQLADQEQVNRICLEQRHFTSSHLFSSLYLWKDTLKLEICLMEHTFMIRQGMGYFFPCGNAEAKIDFIRQTVLPERANLWFLREEDAAFLEEHFPGQFTAVEDRAHSEYVYLIEEQVNMQGGSFAHTRKKIRHANAQYQLTFEKIGSDNLREVVSVTNRWKELHECKSTKTTTDMIPVMSAIEHYEALKLEGLLMYENGTAVAYVLGTAINQEMFDIHIAKNCHPDIGVDLCCKHEFYQWLQSRYTYVNREEDLGIAGLRTAKESSHPAFMIPMIKGEYFNG